MNKKEKKFLFYAGLVFAYCIIVTVGTYAYLYFGEVSDEKMAGEAGCLGVNYQGQEINNTNLSSTTNYLEGAKSVVTLSKMEDCDIYTYANIYMHVNDDITLPIFENSALRYVIYNDTKLVTEGFIEQTGDLLLVTVPLTEQDVSYSIYVWVDSNLSSGEYDNKSFSGYIYATSEQASSLVMANDLSGRGNNGIAHNNPIWDVANGTLTTTDDKDFLECGLKNYEFGDTVSLVVRVKIMKNNNYENVVLGNFESGGTGLLITKELKPSFCVHTGSYFYAEGVDVLDYNKWYTMVGVYNGHTASLYLDGKLLTSIDVSGEITQIDFPFILGGNPGNSNGELVVHRPSNVVYSDVLMFDRALEVSEVQENYGGEIDKNKVNNSELLLYYDFK